MAETVTKYRSGKLIIDEASRPLSTSKNRTKVFSLTKVERLMIVFSIIIALTLTVLNLKAQMDRHQTENVIQNYETQRLSIQAQTDKLLNNMSEQYNYQSIKQVATENGMTIDPSRVRSVE